MTDEVLEQAEAEAEAAPDNYVDQKNRLKQAEVIYKGYSMYKYLCLEKKSYPLGKLYLETCITHVHYFTHFNSINIDGINLALLHCLHLKTAQQLQHILK